MHEDLSFMMNIEISRVDLNWEKKYTEMHDYNVNGIILCWFIVWIEISTAVI